VSPRLDGGWDIEIDDGIYQKTVSAWGKGPGRSQRSGSKKRLRITREAVEKAVANEQSLYVLEYEKTVGGSAGSRGNSGSSYTTLTGGPAHKLILSPR